MAGAGSLIRSACQAGKKIRALRRRACFASRSASIAVSWRQHCPARVLLFGSSCLGGEMSDCSPPLALPALRSAVQSNSMQTIWTVNLQRASTQLRGWASNGQGCALSSSRRLSLPASLCCAGSVRLALHGWRPCCHLHRSRSLRKARHRARFLPAAAASTALAIAGSTHISVLASAAGLQHSSHSH